METVNAPIPEGRFVFVSYARKDSNFVLAEIKRLEEQHHKIWYDRKELQPGRDWDDEISKAIKACACFMVFVTEDAAISKNVGKEIEAALKAEKPFIGVYWDDVKLTGNLQERVRRKQVLDRHSMFRLELEYEEPLRKALSEYLDETKLTPLKREEGKEAAPAPVASSDVLPKIVFFSLILLGVLFLLFAVIAFATPYLPSTKPDDPLNNRLAGLVTGLFLAGIALGLEGASLATYRIYLRKKK